MNRLKKIWLVAITGFILYYPFHANGQSFELNRALLDSIFYSLNTQELASGCVAISSGGEEIYSSCISFDSDKQNDLDKGVFAVGSVSKLFTSLIILNLVDSGLLRLEMPICTYLPKLKDCDKITIEHLLSHRSGIPDFAQFSELGFWLTEQDEYILLDKIIRDTTNRKVPGSQYLYSNSNYILLTYIMEKVTNKSYGSNLEYFITSPLALNNTITTDNDSKSNQQNILSYRLKIDEQWITKQSAVNHKYIGGAGGIYSTPRDINVLMNSIFDGERIISDSLMPLLIPDSSSHYGLGIMKIPFYEHIGYGHTGNILGFKTVTIYFPEYDLGLTICLNASTVSINSILIATLESIFVINETSKTSTVSENFIKSGIYHNPIISKYIKIQSAGEELFARASGQMAFPLKRKADGSFAFRPANIKVTFSEDEPKFLFSQNNSNPIEFRYLR